MSVILLLEIEIHDPQTYAAFAEQVTATLTPFGGRHLARSSAPLPVAGGWKPERVVLVEFPDAERLRAWHASPAYQAIAPLRERATTTRAVVVDGLSAGSPALVPELYVSDLQASLSFWARLGFEVDYARPEHGFASLRRGGARVMLEQAPALARATPEQIARGEWRTADLERPFGRGLNLEIQVEDLDALAAALVAADIPLLVGPERREYRVGDARLRVRQLVVEDPDGYLVRLSQRLALEALARLELRPATPDDLRELAGWIRSPDDAELWAGWRVSFPVDPARLPQQLELERASSHALAGEQGLVGFGQIVRKPGQRLHLARLIVRPEARGHGLGRRLTAALVASALEAKPRALSLNVSRANAVAIALYASLGFREAARPPDEPDAPSLYMERPPLPAGDA